MLKVLQQRKGSSTCSLGEGDFVGHKLLDFGNRQDTLFLFLLQ